MLQKEAMKEAQMFQGLYHALINGSFKKEVNRRVEFPEILERSITATNQELYIICHEIWVL